MPQPKTILNTLEEFDAGVFANKLTRAAQQVALGVVEHNKAGEINVTLKVTRIGDGGQVKVDHKLKYTKPTMRGKSIEEDTTSTPMHVSARTGQMSVTPDNQTDLFTPDITKTTTGDQ